MTDEEKDLIERRTAAEEKLAQVRERIAEKERQRAIRAEAEAAERHLVEAEKLEELIEKHGPLGKALRVLTTPEGHMIVVKAPGYQHTRRFQSKGIDKPDAQEELVRACLVYPSQGEFVALRDRYALLVTQAANEIVLLATAKQEELPGK